jgi:hypothetical protein
MGISQIGYILYQTSRYWVSYTAVMLKHGRGDEESHSSVGVVSLEMEVVVIVVYS